MRKFLDNVKTFGKDQDGVVSFEYIIVAACVVTVVITFFTGAGSTSLTAALTTGIGKITAAMGLL